MPFALAAAVAMCRLGVTGGRAMTDGGGVSCI